MGNLFLFFKVKGVGSNYPYSNLINKNRLIGIYEKCKKCIRNYSLEKQKYMGDVAFIKGENKMKELTIIKEQEVLGKQFRIYGDKENPLFLAKDVASWIEHSKTSIMLKGIDEDEKLRETIFTSGQNREMWFLTENGLYEVLMLSRKPIAKKFKKEVKKILKQIRQTGGYIPIEESMSDSEIMARALLVAQKTINNKDKLIEQQQIQLEEQKPKVQMADRFILAKGLLNIGEVAKLFNERLSKSQAIGRNLFYSILRDEKVLMTFGNEKNNPQQRYINQGYFELKTSTYNNGYEEKITKTTKVTEKGVNWLWNFLIKKGYINI